MIRIFVETEQDIIKSVRGESKELGIHNHFSLEGSESFTFTLPQ